ncbi:MAG: fibronectin type III domain-containing protein [Candidatus Marinimicrobia bacterium]|nr:fibronectin type III domain-containing protein [Candidatus Neomarinimicrobiota bacterium]
MKYWAFYIPLLIVVGCSERERTNPLDPANPYTGGSPSNFQALANDDQVTLTWSPVDVDNLVAYHVYRATGDSALTLRQDVPANSTFYWEDNLNYDQAYSYTVQAITTTSASTFSDTDTVIPGPYNFWIADAYSGVVTRLSYDGAHVLNSVLLNYPSAIINSADRLSFWTTDYYDRAVYVIDKEFDNIYYFLTEGSPLDLTVDVNNGHYYILQASPAAVLKYDSQTNLLASHDLPVETLWDGELIYNRRSARLWFVQTATYGLRTLYYSETRGNGLDWKPTVQLSAPLSLQADNLTGGCWVATDSGVARVDTAGGVQYYRPGIAINDLSIHPPSGQCYFTAHDYTNDEDLIGIVNGESGQVEVLQHGQLDRPGRIQVLPAVSNPGYLVYHTNNDRRGGLLKRYDGAGDVIGMMDDFSPAINLAVEQSP